MSGYANKGLLVRAKSTRFFDILLIGPNFMPTNNMYFIKKNINYARK